MNTKPRQILIVHEVDRERSRLTGLIRGRYGDCRGLRSAAPHEWASSGVAPVLLIAGPALGTCAVDGVSRWRDGVPDCQIVPLLSFPGRDVMRKLFRAGAADCLTDPVDRVALFECVDRLQLKNSPGKPVPASPPVSMRQWMTRARDQLRLTCLESTRALVAAVEAKDPHTRAHSLTVSEYADAIGRELGLSSPQLQSVRTAALLHDIGKIGIPDAILTKPGPLNTAERRIIERHPAAALEIMGHLSFLAAERPLILHHHERFDGQGYPARLQGENIPLGARIIAMADSLDAMLTTRSYKPAYAMPRVRHEVQAGIGGQFDPDVARATLQWMNQSHPAAVLDMAD